MTQTTNWRGAGFGADPEALFQAGGNLARYGMYTHPTNPVLFDRQLFLEWVTGQIIHIRNNILIHATAKNRFVIDMHTVPGGWTPEGKYAMFTTEPWAFECLVDAWKFIATEFKDDSRVHVYDLCNEPNCTMTQCANLMKAIVAGVRSVDPKKRLSVSSANGSPGAFKKIAYFPNDKNIWYTFHAYSPFAFSNQGLPGRPTPVPYKLNKQALKQAIIEPIKFSIEKDVKIYVGEFSASIHAPQTDRIKFISDYISIFEEYGFQWSWHCWREAPVWSCENTTEFFDFMKSKWAKNV